MILSLNIIRFEVSCTKKKEKKLILILRGHHSNISRLCLYNERLKNINRFIKSITKTLTVRFHRGIRLRRAVRAREYGVGAGDDIASSRDGILFDVTVLMA